MADDGFRAQTISATIYRGLQLGTSTVWFVPTGAPDTTLGANGDLALRFDGTLLGTIVYRKAAGVWVGLGVA